MVCRESGLSKEGLLYARLTNIIIFCVFLSGCLVQPFKISRTFMFLYSLSAPLKKDTVRGLQDKEVWSHSSQLNREGLRHVLHICFLHLHHYLLSIWSISAPMNTGYTWGLRLPDPYSIGEEGTWGALAGTGSPSNIKTKLPWPEPDFQPLNRNPLRSVTCPWRSDCHSWVIH